MVNNEELTALLELVQAATGGSFELDRALSEAFGEENEHGVLIVADRWLGIAPISTSIDAALALTERVLPGWRYDLHSPRMGQTWEGVLMDGDSANRRIVVSHAASMPLAIIAAVLAALIAQAETL